MKTTVYRHIKIVKMTKPHNKNTTSLKLHLKQNICN